MSQPLQPPKDQVTGNAPSTANISLKAPKNTIPEDDQDKFQEMSDALDSVIALSDLHARLLNFTESGGVPLKITDPNVAASAFSRDCNHAYGAIEKTLGAILLKESQKVGTFNSSAESAELHLGFLNKLFEGFNLGDSAKTQFDTLLKNTAENICSVKFGSDSKQQTIGHFLRVTSIKRMNNGRAEEPVKFYEPFVTMFYLKIKQSSFEYAVSKRQAGNVQAKKDDFNMEIITIETKVNLKLWRTNRERFDQILQFMAGKTATVFGDAISRAIDLGG